MLALLGVITTVHLAGAVPRAGGDYLVVPFTVPVGTVEFSVEHDDGSDVQVLDWGVWSPAGFRGWGGGLTDPAVVGVEASSRGYLPGPIAAGQWQVVVGKAQLGVGDGAYTIDLEFRDAATITSEPHQPWTAVTLASERRWYAGDFHVHSRDSGDASASLDEIASFARGRGLDFVVLSDHNTVAQLEHQAAKQATLTDLLLLRGAEVTTYRGHGNAVGTDAYVDHRVGLEGVSATTILDEVIAQDGVFIVNHPELRLGDLCIGCAWDHADTPWAQVSGLEIQTGNAELTGSTFTPKAVLRWDQLLDQDLRLAAIGGSDDHRGGTETGDAPSLIGSPTTMVLADGLSEAAILDGVRAGRTVVKMRGPDDPMVIFTATSGDRTIGLGETVEAAELRFDVEAAGGDGAIAELWRDGAMIASEPIVAGAASFEDAPRPGLGGAPHRYRIELTRDGRRITVTSHLYLATIAPSDTSSCGCGSAGGASPGLALALLALRRRGRARR